MTFYKSSVRDVLKSQRCWRRCSSYRTAENMSGSQKDRKNQGRLLNAKWAFSSKYAEETEPSLKL